jgi:hypothetical protein
MKKLIFVLLTWVGAAPGASLWAQSDNRSLEDVITLVDGQVVRGQIVARDTGVSLTLKLPGDSHWTIPDSQVQRITRELPRYQRVKYRYSRAARPLTFDSSGVYGGCLLGMGFPYIVGDTWLSNQGSSNLGLYLRAGYRLRPGWGIGLAMGIQGVRGGSTLPLLVEVTGNWRGQRAAPMYLVQAGWGTRLTSQNWWVQRPRGGPMAQVGVGAKVFTRSRWSFNALLGFRYQQTAERTQLNNWWGGGPPVRPGEAVTTHYLGLFLLFGFDLTSQGK